LENQQVKSIYQNNLSDNKNDLKQLRSVFVSKYKALLEDLEYINNTLAISNASEEESPAALQKLNDVMWYNGSKIYTHAFNGKFYCFCSNIILPREFSVRIRINKLANNSGYTMIGLSDKKLDIYDKSYLGNAFGQGNLGVCNVSVIGAEGSWVTTNHKISEGSTLTIEGNNGFTKYYIDDVFFYEYEFKNGVMDFYLAANCYYQDELEILN